MLWLVKIWQVSSCVKFMQHLESCLLWQLKLAEFWVGAQENWYTSMLWSIDSCQNKVSADQYHLTVSRAQVSTHRGRVFFEVIRWQFIRFQMIADSRLLFFKIHIKYVVFLSVSPRTITILTSNWNSASFFKIQAGKTFSYHGHLLVTLHVQFLCSDWLKFDRWVHA